MAAQPLTESYAAPGESVALNPVLREVIVAGALVAVERD